LSGARAADAADMTPLDSFSMTTVPIEQFFNSTRLGAATSFIWKHTDDFYLITNWHVVTGRSAVTGKHLWDHAAEPNKLRGRFNLQSHYFARQLEDLRLRDEDNHPKWFVHPTRGHSVDVVALLLPPHIMSAPIHLWPINTLTSLDLDIRIGMDVFVLGYPFPDNNDGGFPVWKRGSIASEPELVNLTTGYLLVDTAFRPGMSGAPVIRRSWSSHIVHGEVLPLNSTPATKFIGVYSGRLHTEKQTDAQLGIVWPAPLVEQIVTGGKFDT
jgi:hypothetical protein